MRLSIKRLAAPVAVLAALAVAVPANSIAQPAGDDDASAAQRSKDRGGKGGPGGRTDPRCRSFERREELAQADVSKAQATLKTAKANLESARAAAKGKTPGTKAAKKAKAKVKKAKKKVKKAKAAVKSAKAGVRNAEQQGKVRGC